MEIQTLMQMMAALAVVLALVVAAAWLMRRFGPVGAFIGKGGRKRLGIVEVTMLDAKSRLVLLRRDEVEHLVAVGPGGVVVVEPRIVPGRSFVGDLDASIAAGAE